MKPRKPFNGFAYNCVVNRNHNELYKVLKAIVADNLGFKYAVIIESNQYDDELEEVFESYRQVCYRHRYPKDKNTRIFVKKRWYERLEVHFIVCEEYWTGPQGGLQPGRVFPVAILGRGKKRLVLSLIHI